jgi:hypothetical protein
MYRGWIILGALALGCGLVTSVIIEKAAAREPVPPSQVVGVADGQLTLQFERRVLDELGLRLVVQGDVSPSPRPDVFAFAIDPSSTVDIRRHSDGSSIVSTGSLATCGAILLDRPGMRVVLPNLRLVISRHGRAAFDTTLNDSQFPTELFELASPAFTFTAADRLLVTGELRLADAAPEAFAAAAGTLLGYAELEVRLMSPHDTDFAAPACRGIAAAPDDGAATAGAAAVSGPDVLVADLQNVSRFARIDDITSYGVGTTACNIGTERADWFRFTNQHPVILQGLFRLKNDSFEQVGMAWVKHGFYAVSQSLCSPCTDPTNGTQLGVGCSDPYTASLNGVQTNMSPRADVNAHTGYFPYPWNGPAPVGAIERRLQVHDADLRASLNSGARYFIEGHYVTPGDCTAGTSDNNASYREVLVTENTANVFNITVRNTTQRGQPAVRAWRDADPAVVETDVRVPGEGLFILAAKVIATGQGTYRYVYALQNLNSDRSARSFSVQLPFGAVVSNSRFHDVDYHSGEPFEGVDWTVAVTPTAVTWATDAYDMNRNANALRYDTIYTFEFECTVSGDASKALIGLFKPGAPDEVSANTIGPIITLIDCNGNLIADLCDVDCSAVGCGGPCGGSLDCNANYVPDECEPDCNGNGTPDTCDIADCRPEDFLCADCNANAVPDGCEADCDGDAIPDDCDPPDDADGDGVDDCADACPLTTPPQACVCPGIDRCCFSNGLCIMEYPRQLCIDIGGTPDCVTVPCREGCLLGDWSADGDLDADDFCALQVCFSGSAEAPSYVTPTIPCAFVFDFDDDGDVDLNDFASYQALCSGPREPAP